MNPRHLVLAIFASYLTTACGIAQRNPATDPESLARISDNTICDTYRASRNPFVLEEIVRRRLLTTTEAEATRAQQVYIGMSRAALVCSWGLPDTINTTTTARGSRQQYVYRQCRGCKASYAYLEGGAIVSIQN